jgi:hypothetical protein
LLGSTSITYGAAAVWLSVKAGHDPAIHKKTAACPQTSEQQKPERASDLSRRGVDSRHKAGHDGFRHPQPTDR